MVKGWGGQESVAGYRLMMLLLMEGAAEQLARFLELPLGIASGLFQEQHWCKMLRSQSEPHIPMAADPW